MTINPFTNIKTRPTINGDYLYKIKQEVEKMVEELRPSKHLPCNFTVSYLFYLQTLEQCQVDIFVNILRALHLSMGLTVMF